MANEENKTADFIKLPRLYVDHELAQGKQFTLNTGQAHYLRNVLRRTAGDKLRLFNGRDGEWQATLATLDKKQATAIPEQRLYEQPAPAHQTHLIFAPIKKNRMDFLIEKTVELGATHLHPVLTQNTEIRKINEDRIKSQLVEAAEQCERLDIPALATLLPLEKCIGAWQNTPIYACIERTENAKPLAEILKSRQNTAFLIGPEGGFTTEEKDMLARSKIITPVSLGPQILRSETAAQLALSANLFI